PPGPKELFLVKTQSMRVSAPLLSIAPPLRNDNPLRRVSLWRVSVPAASTFRIWIRPAPSKMVVAASCPLMVSTPVTEGRKRPVVSVYVPAFKVMVLACPLALAMLMAVIKQATSPFLHEKSAAWPERTGIEA